MTHIAVLDHGKSNTRLVLFDETGAKVAEAARPTPMDAAGPYPSEDVEALFPFVVGALNDFASRAAIDAIIPVAHGAAGALINQDGLVLPVVDYEYTPDAALNAAYDRLRPPFEETASPLLPSGLNLGRQLYMLHARFPDAAQQASAFVTLAQYWAFVLSGVMASEVTSLGAHTDLWDVRKGATSSLVERQGWQRLFPPRRAAGDTLGTVRASICEATGLSPQTRVLTGLHDSNASLIPYLLGEPRSLAVVSSGTWVIAMNLGGDIHQLDPSADMLANVDVFGRPTPSARFMGGREFAAIAGDDGPPTETSVRAVLEAGTLALPSFCDQGGPWAGRAGEIVGTLPSVPGARSALASLYCALVTDNLLDRLSVNGPIHVDGPLAKNAVWLGAMAGLRDAPIHPHEGASAASGAAMLALARPSPAPPAPAYSDAYDLHRYRERWRHAVNGREG